MKKYGNPMTAITRTGDFRDGELVITVTVVSRLLINDY